MGEKNENDEKKEEPKREFEWMVFEQIFSHIILYIECLLRDSTFFLVSWDHVWCTKLSTTTVLV